MTAAGPVLSAPWRRPSAVLTGLAAPVLVCAVASWTVPLPSTRAVARAAASAVGEAPRWVQQVAEVTADAGLLALAALALTLTWRARSGGVVAVARAMVAGGGAVAAYVASEALKVWLAQPRPCATGMTVVAECPPPGDWSLPSNHATIAAALAAAIMLIAPRWSAPALLTTLLVAAARVGTGVHYPHDVLTGIALGAGVVAVAALALDLPARAVLRAAARRRVSRPAGR